MAAPTVSYHYAPQYGVEKYLPPGKGIAGGGGAEETNDNLLITLWQFGLFDPGPNPGLFGDIIVPFYANGDPNNPPANVRAAYQTGMKSRVAARFWFVPDVEDPFNVAATIAVLNPPQEFKQQLAGAIKRTGDVPPVIGGFGPGATTDFFEITKPFEGVLSWNVDFTATPLGAPSVSPAFVNFLLGSTLAPGIDASLGYVTSSVFGFPARFPEPPFPLAVPFLKTNGADGNTPEFYDYDTNDKFDTMVEDINRGDYYVPMILFGDPWGDGFFETDAPVAGYLTISWPGSPSRR